MRHTYILIIVSVWVVVPLLAFAQNVSFGMRELVPSRQLEFGMRGEEVRRLQRLLAADPALYPEGLITGYFGLRTRRAVERFQIRHGIVNESDGPANRTGFGRIGPRTLARFHELVYRGGQAGVLLMPQQLLNSN